MLSIKIIIILLIFSIKKNVPVYQKSDTQAPQQLLLTNQLYYNLWIWLVISFSCDISYEP